MPGLKNHKDNQSFKDEHGKEKNQRRTWQTKQLQRTELWPPSRICSKATVHSGSHNQKIQNQSRSRTVVSEQGCNFYSKTIAKGLILPPHGPSYSSNTHTANNTKYYLRKPCSDITLGNSFPRRLCKCLIYHCNSHAYYGWQWDEKVKLDHLKSDCFYCLCP